MSDRDRESREAFVEAAIPHLRGLLRSAARLLGDAAAAEDAIQETFLRAWKSFHRFERGTNCRAWLYRILFIVLAQRRRSLARQPKVVELETHAGAVAREDAPVPDVFTATQVAAAFERLPQVYRDVVLLADVEELTYREIADALAIPLGTVMSRLNRGRRLLRTELRAIAEAYGLCEVQNCKRMGS
ncbi:MAG TPA: sigma-70 family RNA polymerase sigma factor [Vicinamibacterales bacterium]|nr:sigma-70 family RNA polymerase sigma factor [Vicinamibacterales bacterium]